MSSMWVDNGGSNYTHHKRATEQSEFRLRHAMVKPYLTRRVYAQYALLSAAGIIVSIWTLWTAHPTLHTLVIISLGGALMGCTLGLIFNGLGFAFPRKSRVVMLWWIRKSGSRRSLRSGRPAYSSDTVKIFGGSLQAVSVLLLLLTILSTLAAAPGHGSYLPQSISDILYHFNPHGTQTVQLSALTIVLFALGWRIRTRSNRER